MASPQITLLHLEAMETDIHEKESTGTTRYDRMAGLGNGEIPQILLANGGNAEHGYLKQKTRTSGILQYPRQVRVSAPNLRLNRRIPNGTYGGVGGRSPTGSSYPIVKKESHAGRKRTQSQDPRAVTDGRHQQHGRYPESVQGDYRRIYGEWPRRRVG